MDAELKIVGAIVIVLLFLANTGIGIWIYRIMKASEQTTKNEAEIKILDAKITSQEEKARNDKQELSDKLAFEREERIKYEARVKQLEKDSNSLGDKHNDMYDKFITTTQEFQNIATKLNATMKHISGHISGIQSDIKEIRAQVQK